MRFVVSTRRKDLFLMLPEEKRMEIIQGMIAYIEKYRKSGKCKEIYQDADMQGSVSIWDVESDKESTQLMLENPLAPFTDFDIRPVTEWDVAVKAMRESVQKR